MKKLILSLVAIATLALSSFGQAPEAFKYQAVIRDGSSLILTNQAVGMQLMIRQGSAGGPAVYTETFAPTTNGYGLVNLEIGTGTTSDDFTTIDWANDTYFMETAVDVTGGVSYMVMGTSQLMSVPYALHAKTADNVTNDAVNDADADPNNEIQDLQLLGNILTITNNGTATTIDLSGYLDNTDTQLDSTAIANMGFVASSVTCGLSIGDTYQGGIIFYLDPSGCHGLVAAPTDQSTGAQWYNGSYIDTRAYGSGLFEGKYNTVMINAYQGGSTSAAAICGSLMLGGYDDWYLPSIEELNKMYQNIGQGNALGLGNVGGFAVSSYWSSTETGLGGAWRQGFYAGGHGNLVKVNLFYVRAVRAF